MQSKQTGRTMVEMLATLAIIGVLSIAAVFGFSLAVARYKANQITNYVLACVTTSYTKTADTFYEGYCHKIFEEPYPMPIGLENYANTDVQDAKIWVPTETCVDEGTYNNHCGYIRAEMYVSDKRVVQALVERTQNVERRDGVVVINGEKENNRVWFDFVGAAKELTYLVKR